MSEWDAFPRADAQPARRPQPAARARHISFTDDNDAIIRTVIGEARGETPEGRQAVAAVIRNRARQRGITPSQVVLEKNQFEPWGNAETANGLMGISANDPLYQEVAHQIAGGVDPTGGASHFYAPKAQAALGRAKPSWDNGTGTAIGNHLFFNLDGSPGGADEAGWDAFPEADPGEPEVPAVDAAMPSAPVMGTRENPIDITDRNQVIAAKKGDWVRLENGDLTRAAGSAVEGRTDNERAPGIFTRETNLIDAIGAGAMAASEQIPFLDESVAFTTGLATGEGYQAMRDRQEALKRLDNEQQRAARVAGGVAGFGTGLLAPGGAFIGRGASAASRAGRAASVGAGYGALYGAGAADGGASERATAGAEGAAIGGLTGGLLQGGIDRLARGRANPSSAARRLSREGVELTPGQMLQEAPVVGPMAKWAEDLASGYVPFIGGARERSAQSLARAVGNRSLDPIGLKVSKDAKTGYEIASDVYKKLGDAYDEVLPRVQAQADIDVLTDLSDMLNRAANDLPADQMSRLERVLDQGVIDRFTSGGVLDGQEFKRMETRLREMSQRYQRGTVDDTILADYFDETRDVIRGLIARANPAEADTIQNINRGYANYARLRKATSKGAGQGREGTFTPGELSTAVSQLGTENQLATRSALMQDLSADARNIMPPSMGDTGSGQRAVVGALALGGGGLVNPVIPAAAIGGGALLYSRPAQAALNAVYRATDSRAANEGLQTLLDYARRDPALIPVYQQALDHLQNGGGQQVPPPPARPDVLSQAQAGMPAP